MDENPYKSPQSSHAKALPWRAVSSVVLILLGAAVLLLFAAAVRFEFQLGHPLAGFLKPHIAIQWLSFFVLGVGLIWCGLRMRQNPSYLNSGRSESRLTVCWPEGDPTL
jgi:protein-S-isoprenylcysteine O-methyltransferase Ste14